MAEAHYKIGVTAIQGRMGKMLTSVLVDKAPDGHFSFVGGSSRKNNNLNDQNGHENSVAVMSAEQLFASSDCVIDFSHPSAIERDIDLSVKNGVALVIGTTGLDLEQEDFIKRASKNIPIVYAANMSVGVTIMMDLVEKAACLFAEDYDLEIFEAHHKHKIDSPSGTALALGQAAATGRDVNFGDKAMPNMGNREGVRKAGDIGFSVLRGGDIVGEHTVGFYGAYDRFEIKHAASDRKLFADGAVKAALWLKDKPAGLYNMKDVLGLR